MAVVLIKGYPPRYIGTSGDDKPVLDSETFLEAEFIETDTKLCYVWTGSEWVEKVASYIPVKNYVWNTETLEWEAASLNDIKSRLDAMIELLETMAGGV